MKPSLSPDRSGLPWVTPSLTVSIAGGFRVTELNGLLLSMHRVR